MREFIHKNEMGRWVRIQHFSDPKNKLPDVTLLPMIHIGESEYFTEMSHEAWCHDTCYFEGCWVPVKGLLAALYRVASIFAGLAFQGGKISFRRKQSKLPLNEVQNKLGLDEYMKKMTCDCGQCSQYSYRLVHADFHKKQAQEAFAKIPLMNKFALPFLLISGFVIIPFIKLRDAMVDMTDTDTAMDENPWGKFGLPFWKFVKDDRDDFLHKVLKAEIHAPYNQGKNLCVKYGADHMKKTAEFLVHELGYAATESRDVLAIKAKKLAEINDEVAGYGVAEAAFAFKKPDNAAPDDSVNEPYVAELEVSYPDNMGEHEQGVLRLSASELTEYSAVSSSYGEAYRDFSVLQNQTDYDVYTTQLSIHNLDTDEVGSVQAIEEA